VAHVFERFWRGDSARAATGVHCGLGLALVQRAVTAFGGTVDVGVAGGLFAVRVRLPAAKA
jgi:two-component system OmpR family sensor kinase